MKKKKIRIKWNNLISLILFIISTAILVIGGFYIALSTICLTPYGTILTILLVTIAGFTGENLLDEIQ